jgi:S1-C subfamily serine protease
MGIMPSYADEKEGVLLDGVTDNGPAAKAGLKADDRIVEIAGKPVKSVPGYMSIMGGFKKGDKIEVTVRRNGETKKINVTLE